MLQPHPQRGKRDPEASGNVGQATERPTGLQKSMGGAGTFCSLPGDEGLPGHLLRLKRILGWGWGPGHAPR